MNTQEWFTELAWAAGFFDGEGSTYVRWNRERAYPATSVGQVDRRVLDRFAAAVGIGRVRGPHQAGKGRPQYHWGVSGAKARLVIRLLQPWLSELKVEQALAAFATADASRAH